MTIFRKFSENLFCGCIKVLFMKFKNGNNSKAINGLPNYLITYSKKCSMKTWGKIKTFFRKAIFGNFRKTFFAGFATWARGAQKVHKPLSEKRRSCRKSNILIGPKVKYLIFYNLDDLRFSVSHLTEFNLFRKKH